VNTASNVFPVSLRYSARTSARVENPIVEVQL
jgi:hypothetical protein